MESSAIADKEQEESAGSRQVYILMRTDLKVYPGKMRQVVVPYSMAKLLVAELWMTTDTNTSTT